MPYSAWEERFLRVQRPTLLQHFPYAKAERLVNQRSARNGVIKIDGEEVGLVQVGEAALFGKLLHVVSLDRGPLWFPKCDTLENIGLFFAEFRRQFPRRLGRKVRILPEVDDGGLNRSVLAEAGLIRNEQFEGYQTLWLDLRANPDKLRGRMDSDFRRMLAKSEKSDLDISEDWSGLSADGFLGAYEADKAQKGYSGPSRQILEALLKFMVGRKEALILTAEISGELVAGVMLLVHGSAATYQVGFNLEAGRKAAAHHALLWRGLLALKDRGVLDFDLGGVNEAGARGVAKFKRQLGGRAVTLAGFYS